MLFLACLTGRVCVYTQPLTVGCATYTQSVSYRGRPVCLYAGYHETVHQGSAAPYLHRECTLQGGVCVYVGTGWSGVVSRPCLCGQRCRSCRHCLHLRTQPSPCEVPRTYICTVCTLQERCRYAHAPLCRITHSTMLCTVCTLQGQWEGCVH